MPARRLLFSILLLGLVMTGILSRINALAEAISGVYPESEAEVAKIGEWLWLIVSPDPAYVDRGSSTKFTIVVLNTSQEFAMKDLKISDSLLPQDDCTYDIGVLEPGGEFSDSWPSEKLGDSCRYENIIEPFTAEVTVSGKNAETDQNDSASDTARAEVLELTANIVAGTNAIAAPGGPIEFSVTVTNMSSVEVKLNTLNSKQFGDLADPHNDKLQGNSCAPTDGLPLLSNNGDSFNCAFTFDVNGSTGDYEFVVEAVGDISDGPTVKGSGSIVVAIYETITMSLAAENDQVTTGSNVTLTATIQNLDESQSVMIVTLEDNNLGDVTPFGNCSLPQLLGPKETYSCSYEQMVTEAPGEEQSYTLNVSAKTDTLPPDTLRALALATVTVIEPIVLLPYVAFIPRPTSCAAPLLISTNVNHQFYADTRHAVYWFVLTETADVTVVLDNFKPQDGQVTIYKDTGNGCDPETLLDIGFDGSNSEKRMIAVGGQQPGNYYVYVYSGSDLSSEHPYSLLVRVK